MSSVRSRPLLIPKKDTPCGVSFFGAGDRDRTGTDFTPRDFKSLVSACSTTPAANRYFTTICSVRQGTQKQKAKYFGGLF